MIKSVAELILVAEKARDVGVNAEKSLSLMKIKLAMLKSEACIP